MAKEILNRRQNIYTENVPPEIVDSSGFLEATDYATSTTGGTVKVDGTYQIELTSGGKLKAKEITAAGYSDANDASFISKGTLDNLITAGMLGGGGLEWDTLWIEGESPKATNTGSENKLTVTDSIYDYKLLLIEFRRQTDFSMPVMVIVNENLPSVTTVGNNANGNVITIALDISEHDITIREGVAINGYWHAVYGLK